MKTRVGHERPGARGTVTENSAGSEQTRVTQ